MPKRSRKVQKRKPVQRDENQSAFDVLQKVIERSEGTEAKNPAAVALGRLGGLKGGHARAAKMSAKERSASAEKAAKARWAHKPNS